MLYNTGTIAINGNTATGTGTNWTAPASQVRAGQTIIVMSSPVQLFQISSVNSATSITVTPAASPALSGQKYGILVSDIISVDGLAQAMSQLIKEYDENIGAWETFATTSANQSITVTINGTAITIPGIGKLVQKGSNGATPITQGGTGATNAADARKNLELGTASTKNTGTSTGEVPLIGTLGFGFAQTVDYYNQYFDRAIFLATNSPQTWFPGSQQGTIINVAYPSNTQFVSRWMGDTSGRAFFQSVVNGAYSNASEICMIGKSVTVDGNGFIKKASPIVNIFGDGSAETNEESDGVTVQRIDKGVYLIEGCMGLNSDAAWGGIDGGFEIPTDRNKQPLIWLDFEVNADGSVLVKTYHRTHSSAPAFARNELDGINDGEPIDIPSDQFVSVRVEMPANSIWNQKQLAAKKALDDAHELDANEESGS
ncbi:phage tail protein [Enterobacter asburiae]|nr:phage tail protein [Enterobacter asburiae]